MPATRRYRTWVGKRRVVAALGALFIAAAVTRGLVQTDAGAPVTSSLFVSLFVTLPGILLIYGSYWIPESGIRAEYVPTVTTWCVGGFLGMLAFLGVYHVVVEGGMSHPDRAVPILTSFSSLAGFALGVREAQTKTHEREREETVERLRESNRRLERFAYAASHDLQEPLRTVSTYVQLLETRAADDLTEEHREFLEFAVDGAERMHAMVEGLLVYSRIDAEDDPRTTVDLNDVVDDVLATLGPKLETNEAEVRVDELPLVEGDEEQLHRLLRNLVDNAVTFSGPDRPRIHISAQRDEGRRIVSVRDEGIGIDGEYRDEIFDLFTRLHGPTGRSGAGIGLAVCERIVERHRGDIWVESEPGDGSTFSFSLPAPAGDAHD